MPVCSRIQTGMQCRHFCSKTCRQNIYRSKKQIENSLEKKKSWVNHLRKCCSVLLVKNFDRNAMLLFLHEKLQIAYIVVQETNRKIFRKNKEKKTWTTFSMKMPLGQSGQEFGSECNVTIFARKFVRSIYRGPRNKQKILQEKKKRSSSKFCTKIPLGSFGLEF